MKTLVLAASEVAALLPLSLSVVAVEEAFRLFATGGLQLPSPQHVPARAGGFHVKSASREGSRPLAALKVNGNFPENPSRFGLPTIQGAVLLADGANGSLLAVMESGEITARRTAAATALAARHLARPESEVAAVYGCGRQGRVQLEALREMLPLRRAYAIDSDSERASAFCEEMSRKLSLPVTPSRSFEPARECDVVVTATTARTAFLERRHVRPGTFVAAVGADHADKQELEPELLARSKLVVDNLDQCAEIGELHHALRQGVLRREQVHAQLAQILIGEKPGRTSPEEITIFDSTGTAVQDLAAAAAVYEKALETGAGTWITL